MESEGHTLKGGWGCHSIRNKPKVDKSCKAYLCYKEFGVTERQKKHTELYLELLRNQFSNRSFLSPTKFHSPLTITVMVSIYSVAISSMCPEFKPAITPYSCLPFQADKLQSPLPME